MRYTSSVMLLSLAVLLSIFSSRPLRAQEDNGDKTDSGSAAAVPDLEMKQKNQEPEQTQKPDPPKALEDPDRPSTWAVVLSDIGLFVPAVLLFLPFHEGGHMLTARIFGDHNAAFYFYKNGSLGLTIYDRTKFSPLGRPATALGGFMGSRVLAELSDLTLKYTNMPRWIQRFFSITFLFSRIDFIEYALRALLIPALGDDITEFATVITENPEIVGEKDLQEYKNQGHRTGPKTGVIVTMFAVGLVDLVLDWDRIKRHWRVVCGGTYNEGMELSSAKPVSFNVLFTGQTGFASLRLSF